MTVERLTHADYLGRRDSGELWQLVDVRETWGINLAAVGGAICIPMGEVPDRVKEINSSVPVTALRKAADAVRGWQNSWFRPDLPELLTLPAASMPGRGC